MNSIHIPTFATSFTVVLGLATVCTLPVGCDPADSDDAGVDTDDLDAPGDLDAADLDDSATSVPDERPEPEPSTPEATDDLQNPPAEPSAVQKMWFFKWYQGFGSAPVPMGSTSDRFCFLNEVRGRFKGAGESVRIYQSNGSWWLYGSSQQIDVMAGAVCIPRDYWGKLLDVSAEYSWSQGSNPVYMGSTAGYRVCFLTRVTGDFEGGGERVEAYRSGGSWWLGGSSGQAGVAASARCVNSSFPIVGPTPWSKPMDPQIMANADYYACGLTRVTGRLEGGGERLYTFISGNSWYVSGASQQIDVATTSFCL